MDRQTNRQTDRQTGQQIDRWRERHLWLNTKWLCVIIKLRYCSYSMNIWQRKTLANLANW